VHFKTLGKKGNTILLFILFAARSNFLTIPEKCKRFPGRYPFLCVKVSAVIPFLSGNKKGTAVDLAIATWAE
jgi:hypothetical protein